MNQFLYIPDSKHINRDEGGVAKRMILAPIVLEAYVNI